MTKKIAKVQLVRKGSRVNGLGRKSGVSGEVSCCCVLSANASYFEFLFARGALEKLESREYLTISVESVESVTLK